MYRVARIGVIVFESRDSAIMRMANRLGLSPVYELEAVIDHGFQYGGVNNSRVPNHIYRWTERDFEKTLRSFDPTGEIHFRYFYGLSLPYGAADFKKTRTKTIVLQVIEPFMKVFSLCSKKQNNLFGMIAFKPKRLWPWLKEEVGELKFNQSYAENHFKRMESSRDLFGEKAKTA